MEIINLINKQDFFSNINDNNVKIPLSYSKPKFIQINISKIIYKDFVLQKTLKPRPQMRGKI